MIEGLKDPSALFRHEIAYVLGQLQEGNSAVVSALTKLLEEKTEHPMVRHEAADALGAIAAGESQSILKQFINDTETVVSESCEVALDIHEYFSNDVFEYADSLKLAAE